MAEEWSSEAVRLDRKGVRRRWMLIMMDIVE
jgi:hypothetical protein